MDRPRASRTRWRRFAVGVLVLGAAVAALRLPAGRSLLIEGIDRSALAATVAFGLEAPAAVGAPARTPAGEPAAERPPAGQPVAASAPAPAVQARAPISIPASYREWVFVGAAVGLSYSEDGTELASAHDGPGMFTHVYLEPGAYHHFRDTGAFPEGTTFVLDMHESRSEESIARAGWFEGDRVATHAAIKDSSRFEGGWGYFNVDRAGRAREVGTTSCRTCHLEHAAFDNVFVQFYPILRELPVAASSSWSSGSPIR